MTDGNKEKLMERIIFRNSLLNDEDKEICAYGLNLLLSTIIDYVVLLLTAGIMGNLTGGIWFLATYSTVRSQAGGYHADTKISCLLKFLIAFIFFMLWSERLYLPVGWCMFVEILAAGLILLWAPVEAVGIPISRQVRKAMKRRALFILGIWILASGMLYLSGSSQYEFVVFAMIWIGVVLVTGKIKLFMRKGNEYEENEND